MNKQPPAANQTPSQGRPEYASKPITFEFTRSRTMQIFICGLISTQFVIGVCLLVGGSAALFYCRDVGFAGYTPVTGGVYLALSIVIGFYTYKENRLVSLGASILNVLLSVFLAVTEALTLHCINPVDTPDKPCKGFRQSANICGWATDVEATQKSNSNDLVPFSDPFFGGRVAMAFFAVTSVIVSVGTIAAFLTSNQMTGSAVYLYRKRNKSSYVVGDINNVALAFDNEEKNLEITMPTIPEAKQYDDKRASFGGKKLITSTLQSLYNTSAMTSQGGSAGANSPRKR